MAFISLTTDIQLLNNLSLQRFIIMLSNHIANSETHGQEVNTLWFKWALDRLRQVFLQVCDNGLFFTRLSAVNCEQ